MATSAPTLYSVLGVLPSADQDAIKSAYRSLAKRHHPDVNTDASAAKRFAAIAEAYEVLSDPERRREYDLRLRSQSAAPAQVRQAHYSWQNVAAPNPGPPEPPDESELDEMYDTFFAPPKSPPKVSPGSPKSRTKPGVGPAAKPSRRKPR